MKRSMCGLVLLAVTTGLGSCNGDPTEFLRTGEEVIADPTSLFVNQGESKFVTVQLVDDQGNQLAADVTPQNVNTAVITVVQDDTYLQTTNDAHIPTSKRFIVTGVSTASTSFDLAASTDTLTIPVNVITQLAGTDAPATAPAIPVPAAGQTTVSYDNPDFATTLNRFYRLDVVEAGDYTITVDWGDEGSDLDVIVCTDITCATPNPQFGAATGAHPESAVFTLTAGTQVLLVNDFGEDAAGTTIKITIQH